MESQEMIEFRDILWELSKLQRDVKKFNSLDCGVKIDTYLGSCMLVNGIEKIADFFGFEVNDGFLKSLNLFDVEILERKDETLRNTD